MKRTPMYEEHVRLGGKMIDFGGWELPVQYSGIIEEHEAVRSAAGLFDVSHMGEILVKGPESERFIQHMVTNDIAAMKDNQVLYSPMCYPNGGVVDDLLVYRINREEYLLVVNASNTEKDFDWLKENAMGKIEMANVSDSFAQLAIQGPKAEMVLQKLTQTPLGEIGFFNFKEGVELGGLKALVSRTGYTGEDGFEIYVPSENGPALWRRLLEEGSEDGLVPVGLGARDTLRFEAVLPLYGQEISRDISPLEARLGFFVKLDKDGFIGREALLEQKEKGLERRLVGFEMLDRGIPRSHYDVQSNGENIGFVTTGSFSPSLKKNIGLALVDIRYAKEGTGFDVVVRGKPLKAVVVKTPFYSKKYKK